jgi:tetratricopeptide (TPR) repeat protein
MGLRRFAVALVVLLLATPSLANDGVDESRSLLRSWHEDPSRIDRARAVLQEAALSNPDAEVLTELAGVWFITGEFRARNSAERQTAYEQGVECARRAIAAAPRSEAAHLLYAANTGRLAELRGFARAAGMLSTIREESATVLRLNPSSVDGLTLAASLDAALQSVLGGDRGRAEARFLRALELDPHRTGARMELARFYMASKRWADARRELDRIVAERAPADVPGWTVRDAPEARRLLADLGSRGIPARVSGPGLQAP